MKITFNDTAIQLYSGRSLTISGSVTLAIGETALVLGENASGKTLFLNAIASLFEPEAVGAIDRIDQSSVTLSSQHLADGRVSWLRQEPSENFLSRCSADEIILPFMHKRYQRQDIERLINDVLIEADIDGPSLLSRPIGNMSSGQRQRLAFCAAVAPRPGLLLLDEPFARLDSSSQRRLARMVSADHGETCCVVVTHQPHIFKQLTRVDRHIKVDRSGDAIRIEEKPGAPAGEATPLREIVDAAEAHPLFAEIDLSWIRTRLLDSPEPVNHPRLISKDGNQNCLTSNGISVRIRKEEVSRIGSFSLAPGISLLIGQNGSGKTSLAETLAGAVPLNPFFHLPWTKRKKAYGSVQGSGRFGDLAAIRRAGRSALLPAEPRQWLYQPTVQEELTGTFPDTDDVRVAVAHKLGLKASEVPGDLSYGQQRALSLLSLPSREMEMVVLDEFFSDLSVVNSRLLFHYLQERVKAGDWQAVVISTANLRSFFVNLLQDANL